MSDNLDWLDEDEEPDEVDFKYDPADPESACYCYLWPDPHNECYTGEELWNELPGHKHQHPQL